MKGAIQQDTTRRPALQRTSNARQRPRAFAVAANAAKYVLLTVAGIALFERARPFAFEQRGYEAIGGEVFLLALPLVILYQVGIWLCAVFGKKDEPEEESAESS